MRLHASPGARWCHRHQTGRYRRSGECGGKGPGTQTTQTGGVLRSEGRWGRASGAELLGRSFPGHRPPPWAAFRKKSAHSIAAATASPRHTAPHLEQGALVQHRLVVLLRGGEAVLQSRQLAELQGALVLQNGNPGRIETKLQRMQFTEWRRVLAQREPYKLPRLTFCGRFTDCCMVFGVAPVATEAASAGAAAARTAAAAPHRWWRRRCCGTPGAALKSPVHT